MLELYAQPQLPPLTILQQDLTPLDFFLWGYVKIIVYHVKINDLQRLKACIRNAMATVTPNMFQAMWDDVEYHLDVCRATKGTHVEIY
jgi:hypothetical protein